MTLLRLIPFHTRTAVCGLCANGLRPNPVPRSARYRCRLSVCREQTGASRRCRRDSGGLSPIRARLDLPHGIMALAVCCRQRIRKQRQAASPAIAVLEAQEPAASTLHNVLWSISAILNRATQTIPSRPSVLGGGGRQIKWCMTVGWGFSLGTDQWPRKADSGYPRFFPAERWVTPPSGHGHCQEIGSVDGLKKPACPLYCPPALHRK